MTCVCQCVCGRTDDLSDCSETFILITVRRRLHSLADGVVLGLASADALIDDT